MAGQSGRDNAGNCPLDFWLCESGLHVLTIGIDPGNIPVMTFSVEIKQQLLQDFVFVCLFLFLHSHSYWLDQ